MVKLTLFPVGSRKSSARAFSASCIAPADSTLISTANAPPAPTGEANRKPAHSKALRNASPLNRPSGELHFQDFIGARATRGGDLHCIAGCLADQRARDRRGDRNPAFFRVRFE